MTFLSVKSYTGYHRHRALGIALPVVLAFMILLSACGGSTGPAKGSTGPSTLVANPAPKGDYTANFNPFISSQTSMWGTQGFVYETLLFTNRYDSKVTPWLASSYQQSDDLKTLTFTMRQGVTWTDGKPLTSADVVFTFNYLKANPSLDLGSLWSSMIQSVAAPDANTVTFTLKTAATTAVWYIGSQTFIVPQHIWQTVTDPAKFTNATNPIGTGPYTLKNFTPQLILYTKNTKYWQAGKPAIDQIKVPSIVDNATASLQLEKGQLDWLGVGWSPSLDKTYKARDSEHNKDWFTASNTVTLYLNLKKYPFNLLPVRQAISSAIDRQELQDKASPYAPPASPTGMVLPAGKAFLAPEYADAKFTVDTAKSDSLLQSAGFTKGSDGFYADKSGKKLTLNLINVTGWDDWVSDSQLIVKDLRAIGIDASSTSMSQTVYQSNLQLGKYDGGISWTDPGPTPFYLYSDLLDSSKTAPIGTSAPTNWERWSDPKTDQLLKQYMVSKDSAKQQEALDGLQKIMVEQLPVIPLTYNPYWYEYTTTHVTGWPSESNPYAFGGPSNYPDNEYVILQLKPVS
jgi:peptide/nickel transport system substrate-binding protein